MTLQDALSLGRVSNLPTVWANALTAIVISLTAPPVVAVVMIVFGLSFYYVAGMYLNDACDAAIDAIERPERPIPAGRVSRATVLTLSVLLFAIGTVFIALPSILDSTRSSHTVLSGAAGLITCIVVYNVWHKSNPVSPVIMGLCRVMVYVTAALAIGGLITAALITAAALILSYLIGLTYAAKQENLNTIGRQWPLLFLFLPLVFFLLPLFGHQGMVTSLDSLSKTEHVLLTLLWFFLVITVLLACHWIKRRQPRDIPNAVSLLIAGMSLVDATFLLSTGHMTAAIIAATCFLLTLLFQRFIAGT